MVPRCPLSRRALSLIALLSMMPIATSCSAWKTQVKPVRELLVQEHPSSIRVRIRGEKPLVLKVPQIQGDSLVGIVSARQDTIDTVPAGWRSQAGTRRVSTLRFTGIPIDSIQRVELRKFSLGRTARNVGIGLGAYLAIGMIILLITSPDLSI